MKRKAPRDENFGRKSKRRKLSDGTTTDNQNGPSSHGKLIIKLSNVQTMKNIKNNISKKADFVFGESVKFNKKKSVSLKKSSTKKKKKRVKIKTTKKGTTKKKATKKKKKKVENEDDEFVPVLGEPLYEDDYLLNGQSSYSTSSTIKKVKKKTNPSLIGVGSDGKLIKKSVLKNGLKAFTPVFKKCYDLLKKLKQHKDSRIFLLPVDPIKYNCPNYFTIITKPMDLSTVEEKMVTKKYATIGDWVEDVRQIWKNCLIFNKPGEWAYGCGVGMSDFFEKKMKRMIIHTKFKENPYKEVVAPPKKTKKKKTTQSKGTKKKETRGRKKRKLSDSHLLDKKYELVQDSQYYNDEYVVTMPEIKHITQEEKEKMFGKMLNLTPNKLAKIVKIIQKFEKHSDYRKNSFTLDLNALSDKTLDYIKYYLQYYCK